MFEQLRLSILTQEIEIWNPVFQKSVRIKDNKSSFIQFIPVK
jgi:hypothetical protein